MGDKILVAIGFLSVVLLGVALMPMTRPKDWGSEYDRWYARRKK